MDVEDSLALDFGMTVIKKTETKEKDASGNVVREEKKVDK